MTAEKRYEDFVRGAFTLASSKQVGRGEDPAHLGDTDRFTAREIDSVKAAVGYSMSIFVTRIENGVSGLSDAEMSSLDSFVPQVIKASSLADIDKIIADFDSNVVNKYFSIQNGLYTLK
jgi:hypothetical protein